MTNFIKNTFEAIRGENSKLKTYSVLKTEIGLETYLTDIKNIKHRCVMAKLRLSNHPLLIETGRHSKIECQLRFCPFCPTIIEDKIHFLVQCPNYKDMGENLLKKHILTNGEITNIQKFHFILKQNDLKMTAKFIYDAFEARSVSMEVAGVLESTVPKVVEGLNSRNKPGSK